MWTAVEKSATESEFRQCKATRNEPSHSNREDRGSYLSEQMVAQNMSRPPLPPTFTPQAGKGNRRDDSHPLKPGFL